MLPLGAELVDDNGVQLMTDWINSPAGLHVALEMLQRPLLGAAAFPASESLAEPARARVLPAERSIQAQPLPGRPGQEYEIQDKKR